MAYDFKDFYPRPISSLLCVYKDTSWMEYVVGQNCSMYRQEAKERKAERLQSHCPNDGVTPVA